LRAASVLTDDFHRSDSTSSLTDKKKYKELQGCQITAYAASLFQRVRLADGINFQRLFMSLDYKKNRNQIFSSGEASGASGSFFFFSHDRRFIVKTMTQTELVFMEKLIPDYYKHIKANPKSLLARVYGIYTVKMDGLKDTNLILMGNTLRWQNRADIARVYDLKGSEYSRKVKGEQSHKSTTTLKDINFIENNRELQEINLSLK
jgi:hypothetical protein